MLDGFAELKTPAAKALQDSNVYAKEAIAPGLPDGIKAHLQNQTVPADAKRIAPDVFVWEQEGHIVRVETNGKKGDAGYYKYEETKLHPTDKAGNDTMRWLMLEQGLPVRKAWQEYIKHWDQINAGMLSMVGGAGRFMPRYMGGGIEPRSAWQEPIGARSSRGNGGPGAGNPGGSVPKPSNTIVKSPPPPPTPPISKPGGGGPKPSNTIVSRPPAPKPFAGQIPQWAKRERSSGILRRCSLLLPGRRRRRRIRQREPTWTAKISLRARAKHCRARFTGRWESHRKDLPRKFRVFPSKAAPR